MIPDPEVRAPFNGTESSDTNTVAEDELAQVLDA
jgi:hypothetical protein